MPIASTRMKLLILLECSRAISEAIRAADGVADHGDVHEVKGIQEADVQLGEAGNARQDLGPGRAAKPGVSRSDHARVLRGGKKVCKTVDGLSACASVQKKKGMTVSPVREGHLYWSVAGRSSRYECWCGSRWCSYCLPG